MNNNSGLRLYQDGVAIVTGAASGIGLAIARQLAKNGCEVVLSARRTEDVQKAARDIVDNGGKAVGATLDVRHYEDFHNLVKNTVSRTGRLDFLINNAGIGVGGHTHDYTQETWDRAIDTNLKGVAYGVQAAYPVMVKQGFGHIVNIASLAGLIATGAMAAYCATKHAVVGLSKSLRAEAKQYGVRVSVVCPGIVRTEILDGGKHGILHGLSSEEMKAVFEMSAKPMEVNLFAEELLKDVAKNRAIIILPRFGRVFWWLTKLLPPSFELRLAEKSSIIEAKKRLGETT